MRTPYQRIQPNDKFGRLTVIERLPDRAINERAYRYWKCLCDCGQYHLVRAGNLQAGHVRSCGCLSREIHKVCSTKHGHARVGPRTPEYISWQGMHSRCLNPKATNYDIYGGRGITICDRWQGEHGFENFLADMGSRPDGTSLDREDANKNYEPSNCRWSTSKEQAHSRRRRTQIENFSLFQLQNEIFRRTLDYTLTID